MTNTEQRLSFRKKLIRWLRELGDELMMYRGYFPLPEVQPSVLERAESAKCDYCGRKSVKVTCVGCGGMTRSNIEYHTTRVWGTPYSAAEIIERYQWA